MLAAVRAGRSDALVLRGEAGIGKSALLEHLVGGASGCRVLRAAGVKSEMGLANGALHQLCARILELRERLPVPQRDALEAAFGIDTDVGCDRLVVGLAVLGLLSEAGKERPLVCVIDDAQWLDEESAQIIGFVARRLRAERVLMVCAGRVGAGHDFLAGLSEMTVERLDDGDARLLLLANVQGPLDPAVCDQVIAESHGNPRALLHLPRSWNAADLAGGFGPPRAQPSAGQHEQTCLPGLDALPPETQLLVLAAAAEPLGDPMLLHRAAKALGLDIAAAEPAVEAGLIKIGARVVFADPLVRGAAYRSGTAADRHRVHHALASATDAREDPDRRAWHRARGASTPDEEIAAELERSADRAAARGGFAAAAAFLERAVALTVDPTRRGDRALAAAEASLRVGADDTALRFVAAAETGPLAELQRARADLLRGRAQLASGSGGDAPRLLLDAGRRLERFDLELAREAYVTAWSASSVPGQGGGASVRPDVCRAMRQLPRPQGAPRSVDGLLDGLARLSSDGYAAGAPLVRRATAAPADLPLDDCLRWGWMAPEASGLIWDIEGMHELSARQAGLMRDAGALAELSLNLRQWGMAAAWTGDFERAASIGAESDGVAAAAGRHVPPYIALRLAALRGSEAECSGLIARLGEQAGGAAQAIATVHAQWGKAVLFNGLARYEQAATAARQAAVGAAAPSVPGIWALPELVEAAARAGDAELARDAHRRLAEMTEHCGNDFAAGIEARCRALVAAGACAADAHLEAIDRLGRTQLRPELARAHLLFGEWLRRDGRRVEAREQLRTARGMLMAIGMDAFAERARRELLATGEKVRKRSVETRDDLTPQEQQIAGLARDGMSNPAIGAQLFLSPRTVEWHLRNVFNKLGIRSRHELASVLAGSDPQVARV